MRPIALPWVKQPPDSCYPDSRAFGGNVRLWHLADIAIVFTNVRFRG
jgi:hypothetical protein